MECLDLFVRYASLTGPNRKRTMYTDFSTLRTSLQVERDDAQAGRQAKRLIHVTVPAKELSVAAIESDGILLSGNRQVFMEGEQCTVITTTERMYTGTLRTCCSGLGVRLDELVSTVEDIAVLGIQVGDWVEVNPHLHVTKSRFIKARNLRAISSFALLICALEMLREDGRALAKGTVFCIHFEDALLICALEMLREDGRALAKGTVFCIHFEDDPAGRHECWGIQGGTYCLEDFEESLRIDTLAITGVNGLDEYSVALQGEGLERIATEKNIPYKAISGMGEGNILATAFQVDGLSERGHETGIEAAIRLLSLYLSE